MYERFKLILAVGFFIALLVLTGRAQKDVLEQKAPDVLNFMAASYCPNVQRPDGMPPLIALDVLTRGASDTKGLFDDDRYVERDGQRYLENYWEKLAAERHAAGVPGYSQAWKVRFLEIPNLGPQRESWALTRLMGGMAPEFMYSMATPRFHEDASHWYVDLTDYLLKPNPYAPGNERWIDLFYPSAMETWRAADSKYYAIPVNQVEIAVFYNRNIFERCGITDDELPPKDWAAFMDIQKRLKDHGEQPFLMTAAGNMRLSWMYGIIADMIFDDIYDDLNIVDSRFIDTTALNTPEKIRSIKQGHIRIGSDQWWEPWRIIKDWSQYWYPGARGISETLHFRQGHVAMVVDGSWLVKELAEDKNLDFEYGVFFIPRITRKTSPFATGAPARGVGGATATQYSITKESAQRKDAVEACVDLLMYITAPQNIGPMIKEEKAFLPTVRVGKQYLPERLDFIEEVLDRGGARHRGVELIDSRSTDEWWAQMQGFLGGELTREEITINMTRAFNRAAAELIEEKADDWDWVYDQDGLNTWDVLPTDSEKFVTPPTKDQEARP